MVLHHGHNQGVVAQQPGLLTSGRREHKRGRDARPRCFESTTVSIARRNADEALHLGCMSVSRRAMPANGQPNRALASMPSSDERSR